MTKLAIVLIFIVVLFLVAIDNTHHVEFGCVAGQPVRVRLVFLVMSAFFLGFLSSVILGLYWRVLYRRRNEEKVEQESEAEIFFSSEG